MELRLVIGACSNEHVASWALQSLEAYYSTLLHELTHGRWILPLRTARPLTPMWRRPKHPRCGEWRGPRWAG